LKTRDAFHVKTAPPKAMVAEALVEEEEEEEVVAVGTAEERVLRQVVPRLGLWAPLATSLSRWQRHWTNELGKGSDVSYSLKESGRVCKRFGE
jgi:hypothetical protein